MRRGTKAWPQAFPTGLWNPYPIPRIMVGWSLGYGSEAGRPGVPRTGAEPSLAPKRRMQRRLCPLQEQAELKIRASELRAKEDQLAAEREALERERQELRLEKERVSTAALRVRLREEEVDRLNQVPGHSVRGRGRRVRRVLPTARPTDPVGLPQVASEKYEEGERALREARQVQSEQQARLQQVQKQQERLQQQEQHLHQARPLQALGPLTNPHKSPTLTAVSFFLGTGDRRM